MLMKVAILGDKYVIRKEAEKILKYEDFTIEIKGMWIVKTKVITSNNMGNLNDLKLFQTTPEQNTWNARNQRTTEISHIGHCTRTAESKRTSSVVCLSSKCLFLG
jgi:hypothetical protein